MDHQELLLELLGHQRLAQHDVELLHCLCGLKRLDVVLIEEAEHVEVLTDVCSVATDFFL